MSCEDRPLSSSFEPGNQSSLVAIWCEYTVLKRGCSWTGVAPFSTYGADEPWDVSWLAAFFLLDRRALGGLTPAAVVYPSVFSVPVRDFGWMWLTYARTYHWEAQLCTEVSGSHMATQ